MSFSSFPKYIKYHPEMFDSPSFGPYNNFSKLCVDCEIFTYCCPSYKVYFSAMAIFVDQNMKHNQR